MVERRRLLGPIGVRLAAATVLVAVGAVGVLTVLTLLAARGDVSQLARQEQSEDISAVAGVVTDAYGAAGSWDTTDLRAASTLATDSQATLIVLDSSGHSVEVPSGSDGRPPRVLHGPLRSQAVVVNGQKAGTVVLHFYRSDLPTPETRLSNALVRTVAAGAGLGILLALAVAIALSRRITRPVVALTRAARSMGGGDRNARVGDERGSGELAELANAFDQMADTIAQGDELRRAMVTDVAHELRTPLAILRASTESLAEGTAEPSPGDMVSIHDEVLRLERKVDDLETLARAEASGLNIQVRRTDLSQVAASTIESLRPSYRAAGVELRSELTCTMARVDPDRVDQILVNLLTNALKFTEASGSVSVSVGPDGPTAVMVVADTGTGIPAEELPRVFERFWRGRQAGRVAGSGVGLAVVNTLVHAHGATIDVASDPATGTRFTVRFPKH